ncbi:ArnT family glycosyltransferase [Pseudomonas sp. MLB6B]
MLRILDRFDPVLLAGLGSVVLSIIAILGVVTVGRDGAFYLDLARQAGEHDLAGVQSRFDWPWYPLLLAGTHALLRLPLEYCAYLWSILFAAGTCALMVDLVRQRVPQAAYWACWIVLAMPAVNQFRGDIIRESGFWFFCTLALWLAMRWRLRGSWGLGASVWVAIGLGSLFRLEAVLVGVCVLLWQLPAVWTAGQRRRFAQIAWLPALMGIVGIAVLAGWGALDARRLDYYLELVRPAGLFGAFTQLSHQFAASLINKYSANEAGRIIFIGLSGALLIKCVSLMGPGALAFLDRRAWAAFARYWREYRVLALTALLYLVVLMVFFIRAQFMNSRYLSLLVLLLVPLLAMALHAFHRAHPRLGKLLALIGVLAMLANVISLGARKTHYVEAGHWISAHTPAQAPIFYEDGRIGYYAGRGYELSDLTREAAMGPALAGSYRYFVIEAERDEPWLEAWLHEHRLQVLASFANRKGDTVLVLGP